MTKPDFLRQLILANSSKYHYELLSNCSLDFLDNDVFEILITQLEHKDEKIQFTAISFLINKFADNLFNHRKKLSSKLIQLLFDESSLLSDRAAWAINLLGIDGLSELLKIYSSIDNLNHKFKIIWAIGRNTNVKLRIKEVISLLLSELEHKDLEIQRISMYSLMYLTPLGGARETVIENYDFTKVYRKVKPVALYFSQVKLGKELAEKFYNLISRELKNPMSEE